MSSEPPKKKRFYQDPFASWEVFMQFWWVWLLALVFAGAALVYSVRSVLKAQPTVVVYCAQDQVYAEPVFQEFTRKTGVRVKAVFDSEAVKTVGLANRLLAERGRPQCDVFWGNEEFRARQLQAAGVFRETNALQVFGARTRRMVVHRERVTTSPAFLELTNAAWRGKVALAYPMFGTTSTHFHVLRQHWGDEAWEQWVKALAANEPLLVDGNSAVVKMVGIGKAEVGLTDSDDIAAGLREGLPLRSLPPGPETLVIPNVVAVVRDAPNPMNAELLFRFLPEQAEQLAAVGALESSAPVSGGLQPKWEAVLRSLEETNRKLEQIFLR